MLSGVVSSTHTTKLVDWLLEKYGGRRAKHTGDGIFALFDGPTKAARCALELVPALATAWYPDPSGRPHR